MDNGKLTSISDKDFLGELERRFDKKDQALQDLRTIHRELDVAHSRLLEADGLKSHFLAVIRNEIKNPVGAIMGLARMAAEKKITDQDTLSEVMGTILTESCMLSFQLDNILEAALIEAGEQRLVRHAVDIGEIVEDILKEQVYDIRTRELKVRTDVEDTQPVSGDGEKIRLIVANLISNAVKFNRKGGEIRVALKTEQESVVLSVADQGEGINDEDSRVIFERFKQADMGIARKYSGSGLGLSVAAALAELHGGRLWFEPLSEGGTEFNASFPITSETDDALSDDLDNRTEDDEVLFL